jgi:hypothetical protein
MTVGMGLFLLGVHIALASAYFAPNVTSKGLERAKWWTICASIAGLAMTGFHLG